VLFINSRAPHHPRTLHSKFIPTSNHTFFYLHSCRDVLYNKHFLCNCIHRALERGRFRLSFGETECCAFQSSCRNYSARWRGSQSCLPWLWYPSHEITYISNILITGTQNYTCNATSLTYSTSGTAEAKLIDITQFYTGDTAPAVLPSIKDLKVIGSHYYVPNPVTPGTNVPKFLNTCEDEFFIGTKNASVPNALPTYSVAAVLLKNVDFEGKGGSLAEWVVRTDILGGVVPAGLNTCNAGDAITIPYKAHYLFFKP